MSDNIGLDRSNLIKNINDKLTFKTLFSFYNIKEGTKENNYYCPFHQSDKPMIFTTEKSWRCFSSNHNCGKGDKISFIQKIDNCSLEEAIIKAFRMYAISQPIAEYEVEPVEEIKDYLFITPKNYRVADDGIKKITFNSNGIQKETKISEAPIIITEQFVNTENGTITLSLACKLNGIWREETISRFEMCSRRLMVLAKSGFPINNDNVFNLIEYLSAFEIANSDLKTTYL